MSLTNRHWDSVVICWEVLRPPDHQKSAHHFVLRKLLLFWSDGVLVLVPLGLLLWFLSYFCNVQSIPSFYYPILYKCVE